LNCGRSIDLGKNNVEGRQRKRPHSFERPTLHWYFETLRIPDMRFASHVRAGGKASDEAACAGRNCKLTCSATLRRGDR
jgi:hypothetical protein